jgi:hypothetical protein
MARAIAFTPAQNLAFAKALLALPAVELAASILYLQLKDRPDRLTVLAELQGLAAGTPE